MCKKSKGASMFFFWKKSLLPLSKRNALWLLRPTNRSKRCLSLACHTQARDKRLVITFARAYYP
jgi:hypothetical protein